MLLAQCYSALYVGCCCCFSVKDIVQRINRSLDKGSAEETHRLLQKAEGKFPTVLNRSALLYHSGLREVKQQMKVAVVFLLIGFSEAVGFLTLSSPLLVFFSQQQTSMPTINTLEKTQLHSAVQAFSFKRHLPLRIIRKGFYEAGVVLSGNSKSFNGAIFSHIT